MTHGTSRSAVYGLAVWTIVAAAYIAVYIRYNVPQIDFPYCVGAVLNAGGDPYLAGPLGHCELPVTGGTVVPMPLPPYALALFRPLALLPYALAAELWRSIVVASTVATIVALRALTRLPASIVCAAILPIALRDTIPLGQLFPVVLASMTCAALLFRQDRPLIGGTLLALSMAEPNIGLPACIAAAIFVPRCRLALASSAIAAIVLAVFAVPPSFTAQYFNAVLPAHALTELHWVMQYSIAHLLVELGANAGVAITVGSALYLVLIIVGLLLMKIAVRAHFPAYYCVFVVPGLSLLGGTFVHGWQTAVAVAAGLAIVGSSTGRTRRLAGCAVILLAVPWLEMGFAASAALAVLAALTLSYFFSGARPLIALATSLVVGMLCVFVHSAQPILRSAATVMTPATSTELAEGPWGRHIDAVNPQTRSVALILDVPTWLGLLGILVAVAIIPGGSPGREANARS